MAVQPADQIAEDRLPRRLIERIARTAAISLQTSSIPGTQCAVEGGAGPAAADEIAESSRGCPLPLPAGRTGPQEESPRGFL